VFEDDLVTVYRSVHRRECNERLLVLTAVGVEALISAVDGEFLLQVAPHDAGYAARHLLQYDAENRPPPPLPPPPRVYGYAWVGCAAYILVLVGIACALSNGLVRSHCIWMPRTSLPISAQEPGSDTSLRARWAAALPGSSR